MSPTQPIDWQVSVRVFVELDAASSVKAVTSELGGATGFEAWNGREASGGPRYRRSSRPGCSFLVVPPTVLTGTYRLAPRSFTPVDGLIPLLTGPLATRVVASTLSVAVQYAAESVHLAFERSTLALLAALKLSLDVDCYRTYGMRVADDSPFVAERYLTGITIGQRDHPTAEHWEAAESSRVRSLAGALDRLWSGIRNDLPRIKALAALSGGSVWGRSYGGWGRPNAYVTAAGVSRLASVGLDFELDVHAEGRGQNFGRTPGLPGAQ